MNDDVIIKSYTIDNNAFPDISEGFIKKDEIRFDEPKAKSEDIPFGSMELAVDPDNPIKVEPGKSLHPDRINTDFNDLEKYKLPGQKKSILRFGNPNDPLDTYHDPRVPKNNEKKIKLDKPKEDL